MMGTNDPGYQRASALVDQYRAQLAEVLTGMSQHSEDFCDRMIEQLETDYRESDDPGEKLHAHCALVGLLTTMQMRIEAGN